MGIVIKNNPIGIDAEISRLNESIYTDLINDAQWTNYDAYHRAYKNPKSAGGEYIPEAYTANNNYEEVLLNDKENSTSFFITGSSLNYASGIYTAPVSLIFQVNTNNLYINTSHRADEESRNDVIKAVNDAGYSKYLLSIDTEVPNVYAEFSKENIDFTDMSPYHVFRLNFEIPVSYDCYYACKYGGGFEYVLDFVFND